MCVFIMLQTLMIHYIFSSYKYTIEPLFLILNSIDDIKKLEERMSLAILLRANRVNNNKKKKETEETTKHLNCVQRHAVYNTLRFY